MKIIYIFTEEFWNKPFAKVIRWIFFLPIYMFSIDILFYLYGWGLKFAIWLFFSGWGIFLDDFLGGALSTLLLGSLFIIPLYSFMIIQVCPKVKAGSIIYLILITVAVIFRIILIINNVEGDVGKSIGLSFLALIPYIALFIGAWNAKNDSF